jgi:PTH2 family peptidyl-tRNA hydrolase
VAASFPGAATAIAGAAGCFALGYFLALARLPLHADAPATGDDDSEEDSEDDDDENSGRGKAAKLAAGRKRTGLRLLFWSRNVVTKSDSAKEAERAQAQTAKAPLEIENLAKIIEDFKMVLELRSRAPLALFTRFVSVLMQGRGQEIDYVDFVWLV